VIDAFKMADEVLLHGVQGITDLINLPGLINTDFADVKMIMHDAGSAIMGSASPPARVARQRGAPCDHEPAARAPSRGAGILLNIAGAATSACSRSTRPRGDPRRGAPRCEHHLRLVIDDSLGDSVRVTVIAAGFDRFDEREAAPARPSHLAPRDGAKEESIDVFAVGGDDLDIGDDDFDVPPSCARPAGALGARAVARCSTRADGSLAPGDADSAAPCALRRPLAYVHQVHGNVVLVARADDDGRRDADGLVTDDDSLVLALFGADCALLGLASPEGSGRRARGWRGLCAGVIEATAAAMATSARAVSSASGPDDPPECYEFSPADSSR